MGIGLQPWDMARMRANREPLLLALIVRPIKAILLRSVPVRKQRGYDPQRLVAVLILTIAAVLISAMNVQRPLVRRASAFGAGSKATGVEGLAFGARSVSWRGHLNRIGESRQRNGERFNRIGAFCQRGGDWFNRIGAFCQRGRGQFNRFGAFCQRGGEQFNRFGACCRRDREPFSRFGKRCQRGLFCFNCNWPIKQCGSN